ncbi:MAG TPA: hypothetical protein VMX15_03425, partial [Candidatus Heimdallarchaeota archaeon]|nr:hypothetical protein [Candidatus Heimdallarchaeota archaeon]
EQVYLDAETGASPGGTDNSVYFRLQQNTNPDYLAHFKKILTADDYNNTGQSAGVGYATGAAWHYYRFEVLKTGETTFQIFNAAGAEIMPLTSFGAQGSLSYFPSGLQFLHINGVNGGSSACAQVWVGLSSDAWPAMPMTPLSTY